MIAAHTETDLLRPLKTYFGYDSFRGKQEEIIRNVMAGGDGFVVMPTGAGKSLCYQLPAIIRPGTALVVSPLIALMKNQVDQMRSLGVEAGFLNSSMSRSEYEAVKKKALKGRLKLLYVAPETLCREDFLGFLREVRISFVAVDEAHCISEWGHDFRPEYRRIRPMLNKLPRTPIIALTATATPKVQQDILHNLQIEQAAIFKTSFNRPNLYYEVRPKINPIPQIVKYIKQNGEKSGIVYCLSRKKVEELAELFKVNGIKAVPYHAGLDSETRSRHQDMFLNEEAQVVVATIAFGMGIDKPDVRFVIHYDVPKSIESYYQETGRAGRDGLEGNCIMFYQFSDVVKLEKFMKEKPLSEREAGKYLLYEMAAFAESGVCRRKQILHYFGEEFDEARCGKMCDNCRHPRPTYDATRHVTLALRAVNETGGRFGINYLVSVLRGSQSQQIKELGHDALSVFGAAKEVDEKLWKSVFGQLLIHDFLTKDIHEYGVLKLTSKGMDYLSDPHPIQFVDNLNFEPNDKDPGATAVPGGEDFKAYDKTLFDMLMKLRKEVAQKHNLPPYIIFLENSIEDMATKYPTTLAEFENIVGVGKGKAEKFGRPFVELIAKYVEEQEVVKPVDFVVKTSGKNSADKLFIIQQVDRRTPLEDIADLRDMTFEELLEKMEQIVYSGTKLNLKYHLKETMDDERLEEIYEHFRTAGTDDLETAIQKLGADFTKEEIQLARIQYYSENAI
ncbi:MAG: DNA helicase RecQ [Bacteroidia bacterium]|nr:DNA helicase RecQ [Bacteroidia bacterium]MDW8332621.1 DNA helicase RecQ [Bacteroidia bacterium]